jgi:hypothetical protein
MTVADEGTIRFWLQRREPHWTSDVSTYDFGTKHPQGVAVKVLKHADRTIEVILDGLDGGPFSLREAIPRCDIRGLHVGLAWSKAEVVLRLNGKATCTVSRSASEAHRKEDRQARMPSENE